MCLIGELSLKIAADWSVLTTLLLEPLRVSLKVIQHLGVGLHENGCHIQQKFPNINPGSALVGSSHKNDAVGGDLDRSVLFLITLPSGIGMNEGLSWSTL